MCCTSPGPPRHTLAPESGEVAFASQPGNHKDLSNIEDLFSSYHWNKLSSTGLLEVLSNREWPYCYGIGNGGRERVSSSG